MLALISTLLCAIVGGIGAAQAKDYYARLAKPTWAPSPKVFGPVWTLLYILMGSAAFIVFQSSASNLRAISIGLYLAQLALNAVWSWFFFYWKNGLWAMVDIVAMLILIGLTIAVFSATSPLASLLMAPYLVWVSFATYLNLTINRLNGAALPR